MHMMIDRPIEIEEVIVACSSFKHGMYYVHPLHDFVTGFR